MQTSGWLLGDSLELSLFQKCGKLPNAHRIWYRERSVVISWRSLWNSFDFTGSQRFLVATKLFQTHRKICDDYILLRIIMFARRRRLECKKRGTVGLSYRHVIVGVIALWRKTGKTIVDEHDCFDESHQDFIGPYSYYLASQGWPETHWCTVLSHLVEQKLARHLDTHHTC